MRLVVAIGAEEPFSVAARLAAYGAYGADAGHRPIIATLSADSAAGAVDLRAFKPSPKAAVVDLSELEPKAGDVVVFSHPRIHHIVQARYGRVRPHFVHLVQSALVATVAGNHGYGYRLFHKPLTRIGVSDAIVERIRTLVGPVDIDVVPPSLSLPAQISDPSTRDPFAVAINAFDRSMSGEALDLLRTADPKLPLKVVDARTPHRERMEIYRSSAVMIASPQALEGFCQPAIEAMAAGCVVVMAQCEASDALAPHLPQLRVVTPNAGSLAAAAQELQSVAPPTLVALRAASRHAALSLESGDEPEAASRLFDRIPEESAA